MITILRAYIQEINGELCIRKPEELVQLLTHPLAEIDIDYQEGKSVKMGSSKDFIGKKVKVGDEYEIEIPEH